MEAKVYKRMWTYIGVFVGVFLGLVLLVGGFMLGERSAYKELEVADQSAAVTISNLAKHEGRVSDLEEGVVTRGDVEAMIDDYLGDVEAMIDDYLAYDLEPEVEGLIYEAMSDLEKDLDQLLYWQEAAAAEAGETAARDYLETYGGDEELLGLMMLLLMAGQGQGFEGGDVGDSPESCTSPEDLMGMLFMMMGGGAFGDWGATEPPTAPE